MQQQVLQQVDQFNKKLGLQNLDSIEQLNIIEQKTHLKPSQVGLLTIFFLVGLVALNVGSLIISNLVGLLYPAYMSFKALETATSEDDKQWLTYWVVFSFFTVFDGALETVLFFLPFYYLFKVVFYVFLFHPQTLGATLIYESLVRPFLLKYQKTVDQKLESLGQATETQNLTQRVAETVGRSE